MASTSPIDRSVVKELWLQGFSSRQISEKVGGVTPDLVRLWASRERWERNPNTKALTSKASQAAAIKDVAQRLNQSVMAQVERIVAKLGALKLDTINDCKNAATALSTAYSIGRKLLGLDDNATTTHFHVVMDACSREREVIDVEASEAAKATAVGTPDGAPTNDVPYSPE